MGKASTWMGRAYCPVRGYRRIYAYVSIMILSLRQNYQQANRKCILQPDNDLTEFLVFLFDGFIILAFVNCIKSASLPPLSLQVVIFN